MAIKFVDEEPEGDRSEEADAPPVAREPDAEALEGSEEPELPQAEPVSKKCGQK